MCADQSEDTFIQYSGVGQAHTPNNFHAKTYELTLMRLGKGGRGRLVIQTFETFGVFFVSFFI